VITRQSPLLVVAVAAFAVAALAGCPRGEQPLESPNAAQGKAKPAHAPRAELAPAEDADVVLPEVSASKTTLLFSYLDAYGRVQATAKIADVPEGVRDRVLVTDLAQTPEQRKAHRYAFFADLTAPGGDGRYPVVAVSRFNAAKGEGLKIALPPVPEGTVIVYSAEWCGFCKKAKAWLKERDVPFVERDVEKQAGVAEELKNKLAAAKTRAGGVPVLDWDGEMIIGFDVPRMEKRLAAGRD
jgi:glutaredoxin